MAVQTPITELELLRPYVPRLLLRWAVEEPHEPYREVDGSIVFVDISGFTAMSERLSRKGKVGAEEVTDILESLFTRLLAVAYGNGGGLIKFGGDALLLLFTGREHEAAAARSAHGMRAVLRDIGRVQTSMGTVTLRMSVGVHSGQFLFAMVGASHRELIITGAAATTTVLMEKVADAGEIVISPATAAALPPGAVGAPKGDGLLLRRVPAGLGVAEPEAELTLGDLDLRPYVSLGLRDYLAAGGDEAEHRPVVVAFVHVGGIDELERRGPAAVAAALGEVVGAAQRAADTHGTTFLGSDIDAGGTKLILVAGAPGRVGDDEERMLHTLRALADASLPLPVRIGVNQGHVFAGAVGPPYRRTYTVMGDAVNLAARLMSKAEPGQVLASANVLNSSTSRFVTAELEPFMVKGKAEPVIAHAVGTALGAREAEAAHDLPLVGRDAELTAFGEALHAARGGSGGLVELVGPPGIGKTRLLQELQQRAGGFRYLQAGCELYASSTPYHPFARLLRQTLDLAADAGREEVAAALQERAAQLAPELAPWLPLVALVLDTELPETREVADLDEQFRQVRLEEATVELLGKLLPGPAVLALEDVHWIDEASSSLLARLVEACGSRPWLLCVTRRDETTGYLAPDLPSVRSLRPQPLDTDEAEALLVAAMEESPLRPDEVTALASRSGGNPLFLGELLQATRAAGGVEGLPSSVEAMVMTQIDRLPPARRRVLRCASVLGTSFAEDVALELVDGDAPGWSELGEFLVSDGPGRWRFRHALVRDAAYEGLPYRRRRELHEHAAATLERRAGDRAIDDAEILSLHYLRAGRYDEAWRYARAAGDQARAKFSNADALTFFRRALEAARGIAVDAAELAGVLESLGDVAEKVGALDESVGAYRAARKRAAREPVTGGRTYRKEAGVAERLGRYSGALRALGQGIRMLEAVDDDRARSELAQLCVAYGSARFRQGRHRDAIRWCERAIPHAERSGDRAALARAYMVIDVSNLELGLDDDRPYAELALAICEELGDLSRQASLALNLGGRAYYEGRWLDAVAMYERARELYARTGDTLARADATFNIGEIRSQQGRLDEAETMLREARRVWRAAGDIVGVAYATSELGRVTYRDGRPEDAMPLLDEAAAIFAEAGADGELLEADTRRVECLLIDGEPHQAQELLATVAARVESGGEVASVRRTRLARLRGCASAQLGELDAAREELEEAVALGRGGSGSLSLALALDRLAALYRLTGTAGAGALVAESAVILEQLGIVELPAVPLT